MFTVQLQSRGNPDFGQESDPQSPEFNRAVADFEAASRACCAYIHLWELGAGNWSGGAVTDEAGKVVARVSYNGRVWSTTETDGLGRDKLLYDPFS